MSEYQEFQAKVENIEQKLDIENFSDDPVDLSCCCHKKQREDDIPLLNKLQTCDLFLVILNRVFVWVSYLILAAAVLLLLYFLSGVFLKIRD
jgi:hypothetical protein